MLQAVIDRYKRQRTNAFLSRTYDRKYAFVGMGQHSLTNLYPVLHYLGVPLKYICVTNAEKAALISRKYPGTEGTTDLGRVLSDPEVAAVFVAANPTAHFRLAQQVIAAGKALFIEKPPCTTLEQLQTLNGQRSMVNGQQSMVNGQRSMVNGQRSMVNVLVGLQKRYAPAVQLLKKRLSHESGEATYHLHYRTGAYPEGDALLDLYIHSLDLVSHLFGPATVIAARRSATQSYILMLEHGKTVGTLELSTAYTWTAASEQLQVHTSSGHYRLTQLETLTYEPRQRTLLSIPLEKVRPANPVTEQLYGRNNFTPTPSNNQLLTQGFYDELLTFADLVEGRKAQNLTPLSSLIPTFHLIEQLRHN